MLILAFLLWGGATMLYAWPLRAPGIPPPLDMLLLDALPADGLGAVMMVAGVTLYGLALAAFGHSWRMGIDRKTPGALVTHGIFAWTRNPIYLSLDLLVLGTFLIQGRLLFLGLSLLIAGLLHDQIRREERYLAEAYGDAYRDYRARVGRYFTLGG
jgi:protein-S-isoprenylcysteine O-methyltransferase Ste14